LSEEERPGPYGDTVNTGPNTITVTVENGYPSYHSSLLFDIENIGTVPVKVESILLTSVSVGSVSHELGENAIALLPCETWGVIVTEETCEIMLLDFEEMTQEELDRFMFSIHLSEEGQPLTGFQIDPPNTGQSIAHGDIDIHVMQSACEMTTYDFSVQIVCTQWNMVP
jgi:hypothetical protein